MRGGPGTGKTTVLAQYVRDTTAMALWFGLTPASRDPVVFFSQRVRLFQGACPWVTGRAVEIVDTLGAGGLAHAAGLLCDELGSEPETRLVVVADDIQVLGTEPAAAEALETLVRLFPEASQLVLCGRSMPPLKTAQYQIQGQIVAIDEVDLALTTPEVKDLLKASRAAPDMGGADTAGADTAGADTAGADTAGAATGRADADTGRAAVHMAVTRLRRALEPDAPKGTESRFILYQDGRYLFNRGVRHAFDVTDYREILRRARRADLPDDLRCALLEQAVALYRGPFMAEYLDVPWCELERESLRRQMQEAYDSLFELHAARDDWQAIERLAEANLRLEPQGESAYRAQIVALPMHERSDDARRLCRIASRTLRKVSGTGIEPETAELLDLVRGDRLTTRAARSCLARPS